jgi:hypothetical protein
VSLAQLATTAPDPDPLRDSHPWRPTSVLWLAAGSGLALILIVAGYVITSGTLRIGWQLAGINVALGALVLQVAASVAWTTGGYRSVRLRQRRLLRDINNVVMRREQLPASFGTPTAADRPCPTDRIVVQQGTVHHLRSCPLVAGKPIALMGDEAAEGRAACRLCQP